jgi:chromosome segregation ATPase
MNAAPKFIEDPIQETAMETRVAKIESHVEHIMEDVKDIKLDIRKLEESLDAANDSIKDLQGDVRVIHATLPHLATKEDLSKAFGALTEDIRRVEGDLGAEIKSVEGRLNTKIESVEGKLNTKIESVEGRLNTEIKGVEGKLNTKIESVKGELSTEIKSVGEQVKKLECGIGDKIQASIGAVEARLLKWFIGTMIACVGAAITMARQRACNRRAPGSHGRNAYRPVASCDCCGTFWTLDTS